MLKSDQLLYRINHPYIKPRFIDRQSAFLLDSAGELLNIYSGAMDSGMTRMELEEITASIIRKSPSVKVTAGLNKLLFDRCEFSTAADTDYPALRKKIFLNSARALTSGNFPAGNMPLPDDIAPDTDIYGDLPDFEKLISFRRISSAELLDRYNLAQAQGLLFYAKSITLLIRDPDNSQLRKLLKSIKFFRLLANFSMLQKNLLQIEISGPCSIFGPTAKYALQLANFFPAVVSLPDWKLSAQIKIKDRELLCHLSRKDNLVSHYRSLASYIPEEIKMFHRDFAEKQSLWKIVGNTPFIDAGNQQLIFPDLSFAAKNDCPVFHLELFHRWHASQLESRIELLAKRPELPLMLGIDRALVKNDEQFDSLFVNCPEVKDRCWLFRDFPGISNTLKALEKLRNLLHHRQ
ncbi:MAG: DUF790 family protein [Lentisphaerae bacterium]|nr:DUF790 family protein [Lentisphaerota bacterium]